MKFTWFNLMPWPYLPADFRDTHRRLYRLRARTLVLWGAADRLIPPVYATRWGALIPGARVERVAGAGHMLPYEQPEAFARIVGAFVG